MRILTFDIEDWFHLLDVKATESEESWEQYPARIYDNMDRIFKLLEDTKQPATFFCLGWIARRYPDIIKRIDEAGYEIATHSDLHQLAYKQTPAIFEQDLERSVKAIEDLIGKKIIGYRAPGFSLKKENTWVFEILAKLGIEQDCSIFPAKRGHGGFAEFGTAEPCWVSSGGIKLKEFPINLQSVLGQKIIFSGGGYFRFFPQRMLKKLFKESPYTMTYFHPRDFDAGQPKVEGLSAVRKFKSYYGLDKALPKLQEVLESMDFVDLKTADQMTDWSKARIVQL